MILREMIFDEGFAPMVVANRAVETKDIQISVRQSDIDKLTVYPRHNTEVTITASGESTRKFIIISGPKTDGQGLLLMGLQEI